MSYIPCEDRGQAALLPAAIEDYVAADAPVRVIGAFEDGLDVGGLGFGRAVPAAMGRPPYDPRELLKLYVYGYLNEVRSSRRLERECSRKVEVMWLLRRTIADFRCDNGTALVGTCRAFAFADTAEVALVHFDLAGHMAFILDPFDNRLPQLPLKQARGIAVHFLQFSGCSGRRTRNKVFSQLRLPITA